MFRYRPREAFASDRIHRSFNARFSGKVAGARHSEGYRTVTIDGHMYLAHRVIWLWLYGVMPGVEVEVDHINRERSDNRQANLRLVSRIVNSQNHSLMETNTSGVNGVFFDKRRSLWRVEVGYKGRSMSLSFKTRPEAIACRKGIDRALGFAEGHGAPRTEARLVAAALKPSPEASAADRKN